jgi:hypothetical protein
MAESLDLEAALVALEMDEVRRFRGEVWCHCPLPDHPGRDATGTNFSLNEETFYWKCFTCDEGGGLPALVARLQGFEDVTDGDEVADSAWQQALRWLAPFSDEVGDDEQGRSGGRKRKRQNRQPKPTVPARPALPSFAPGALSRYEACPLGLLAKWHIDDPEVVREYGLRYDPEHERAGYVGRAIIIPHVFEGRLVGYQERWLDDDRPDHVPKYTNSQEFPKTETLYNWDRAREASERGERVVAVESVMTVVRLACLAIPAAGTFGASLTDRQLRLLGRLRAGVALSFDNDPPYLNESGVLVTGAGVKALRRVAGELRRSAPVWIVPRVAGAKGDLADLNDGNTIGAVAGAYPLGRIGRIKDE